ncbi:MAG: chlorophyll synthesis pathway protein BchC [Hyphomicrobiaceae bacterium]|nr:chlorophyll synthesis pathway protein BchC [Hyphomicrobiaceae bacterium]
MEAMAVILKSPGELSLGRVDLTDPGSSDIVVDILWSGISTGTERLLYTGEMPPFPGMGYPLVPGYESVGRVAQAASDGGSDLCAGDLVFVPGARCFKNAHGLFGGAAQTLVVPAGRVVRLAPDTNESGVLIALAATARHALAGGPLPSLIVGHGVLGRLFGRLIVAAGGEPPVVWEKNPARCGGAEGYSVVAPEDDTRRDYAVICDASGDAGLLDQLVGRLAPGGEIVLAGFYKERLSFAFPPAFMREARFRIAAQWQPDDLAAVLDLIQRGRLSLGGLITHLQPASHARDAYAQAFEDPACLKMVLDWRQ